MKRYILLYIFILSLPLLGVDNGYTDYRFDELRYIGTSGEIKDSHGNNNGKGINVSTVEGKICNAIDLRKNSKTDYAILSKDALNGVSDFTISVWHKGTSTSSRAILSGAKSGQDNEILFWMHSDRFYPHIHGTNQRIDIANINDGNWHHLVWRLKNRENCFFFDGLKSACKTFNYSSSAFSIESLILGQDQDSVGGRFDENQDWEGMLDELLIFRRGLSDSEIQTGYNNQNTGKNWDGTTRVCQNITPPLASCTKTEQILLSTYNINGYNGNGHPDGTVEYKQWVVDNATTEKKIGSGFVDQIKSASTSNSNPYHSGTDSQYLAVFKGYIYLPESGNYKFGIDGDDAIEVYMDNALVSGWYGGHGRKGHAVDVKYLYANSGYHKIEYHMEERYGGDNYYLYWEKPSQNSMEIVPSSQFFHCQSSKPSLSKTSCVISDPVNGTTDPKRIPGAVVRYALLLNNDTDYVLENGLVEDDVASSFDSSTIKNIQIKNGTCDCLGVSSASNNGSNGTGNGVNPVKLDYGSMSANSKECGYFEVEISK